MKHPLKWVREKGMLAESLGLNQTEPELCAAIEKMVEGALENGWTMRKLFESVGELDMTDECWANFLYTYGWWDGRRHQ